MSTREPMVLCWSGGKDSAMALNELRRREDVEVVELLTTVAREYERVSHHGVRVELLDLQAAAIDLPLYKMYVSPQCTNEEYESRMSAVMFDYKSRGIHSVAFGDIFLEDLRAYREDKLAVVNMEAHFPIWKRDTTELVRSFIDLGFRVVQTRTGAAP